MSENNLPIIHIGMPKTASTTLQGYLFSDRSIFFPLGRFGKGGDHIASEIINELLWEGIFFDEFNYETRKEKYKVEIKRLLSEAQSKKLPPILSQETFGTPRIKHSDFSIVFSRLKDLFGDCQILMLVREQESWLKSWYSSFITDMGGTLTFEDFIFLNRNIPGHEYNVLSSINYDHILSILERYFSKIIVRSY